MLALNAVRYSVVVLIMDRQKNYPILTRYRDLYRRDVRYSKTEMFLFEEKGNGSARKL